MPTLAYTLHRTSRRTLSVEVHPSGAVHVRSPMRMSHGRIESFLVSRLDWIVSRLQRVANDRSVVPQLQPRQFHHRGRALSWGTDVGVRKPTLRVDHAQAVPTLLLPSTWTPQRQLAAVSLWQRREAHHVFGAMINETMPVLGLESLRFRELRLRRMTRRWGSCSTGGVITLNERLIAVPDDCIRAVVVHEMCHLVHMHHGPSFHALVHQVMPSHRQADALLDKWSAILSEGRRTRTFQATEAPEQRTLAVEQPYAEVLAQTSSNAAVSDEAIISGVRPSI
jgi:predicted metal-dependent hydrolase